MHHWTAEELLDAAYVAVESKRFQDAVTVLVYIVQTYPETVEAAKARDKYRAIMGEPFPEGMKLKERASADRSPQGYMADLDFAGGEQLARKFSPSRAPEKTSRVAKPKPAKQVSSVKAPDTTKPRSSSVLGLWELVDELEDELRLSDRVGRMIALLLFTVGLILLPFAVFLLVFSFAFSNLLLWSLGLFVLAPLLIGLGQIMQKVFALHRANEQLLARLENKATR